MNDLGILDHNRAILYHFDSYSAALMFASYATGILAPAPLPESASAMAEPDAADDRHAPGAVLEALAGRYGLDPKELKPDEDFRVWMTSDTGPIRIHLLRFTTFEAPRPALEPLGGVFKPISQMRGLPATDLNLAREVFNLIMGGG
jgi:hypothetical protein